MLALWRICRKQAVFSFLTADITYDTFLSDLKVTLERDLLDSCKDADSILGSITGNQR